MLLVVISAIYGAGAILVVTLIAAKNRNADARLEAFEDREQMRTLRRRVEPELEELLKTAP